MIVDSLASVPVSQAPDVKVEKNAKAEEPRAIEESDKSEYSQLDMEKQNISKRRSTENVGDSRSELRPYSATDRKPDREIPAEIQTSEYEPLDIVV